VDLHKGITQSCDVFFYNVAIRAGYRQYRRLRRMAGFGLKTGIDLPNEMQGVVAQLGMEDAEFPAEMVRRRDGFGGHRTGDP